MAKERHHGSCQCGAVQFSVDIDLDRTVTCNCSRCQRLGVVWSQVGGDDFVLERGEDALTEYRFNTETIQHPFCATCGIQPFARGTGKDGAAVVMVNVNCLDDGVDPRALTPHHYDGASA